MGISQNIKDLRQQYSLTQSEFGEIAGVSDKAVSTWENGTAEPRMGAIQKISDYFNISKGQLLECNMCDIIKKPDMCSYIEKENKEENKNETSNSYYINPETAHMAQEIYDNKELKLLFDAARTASPQDLKATHDILLALKRREVGNPDE